MQKLFAVSFSYRHGCVSIKTHPTCYFIPYLAIGAIWVWLWDPWSRL